VWPVAASAVVFEWFYYARVRRGQIWMLTLYAKNVVENIPANVLRQIKEEIDG